MGVQRRGQAQGCSHSHKIFILFFNIALGYAHIKLQQELRDANIAQEKAKRDNFQRNKNFAEVKREMEQKRRSKAKVCNWLILGLCI